LKDKLCFLEEKKMEANMEIENDINLIRKKSIHFPKNGAK
jgi:hypothetical protein